MAEKQLIVNADDFGLSRSVNNGIVHGFRHGIITSATIMVNMPFAAHAAALAKKHKLPVGVHLNIEKGKPLSRPAHVKGLINSKGDFYLSVFSLGMRSFFSQKIQQQIELEFDAQIKRSIALGLNPTHLDTHMYTGMYPWVMEIILQLAKKYKVQAVRSSCDYFFIPNYAVKNIWLFFRQLLVALYVSFWSFFSGFLVHRSKVKTTDNYTGIMQICSANSSEAFTEIISNLRKGTTELMVHPGFIDDYLMKHSFYSKERAEELKALTSNNIKKLVKENKIMLISFEDL